MECGSRMPPPRMRQPNASAPAKVCTICQQGEPEPRACTSCMKPPSGWTHHMCCIDLYSKLTMGGDLNPKHRLCMECTKLAAKVLQGRKGK